jgi:DNA-binding response OmpR family regulator
MKPRVLVVDDEPRMAESIALALTRAGHDCETRTSGADALALLEERSADVS